MDNKDYYYELLHGTKNREAWAIDGLRIEIHEHCSAGEFETIFLFLTKIEKRHFEPVASLLCPLFNENLIWDDFIYLYEMLTTSPISYSIIQEYIKGVITIDDVKTAIKNVISLRTPKIGLV